MASGWQELLGFKWRAAADEKGCVAVLPEAPKQGRESRMREALGVSRADVEYVTNRANESHRRHADPSGKAISISSDELAQCFKNTAMLLAKFVDYLPESPRVRRRRHVAQDSVNSPGCAKT